MFCSSFICWLRRFVHSNECSVDISFSFGLWSRWESLFVRVCRLESMFGDTKNPLDLLLSLNKPVAMSISIFNWLSMSMTSSLSSSDFVVSSPPFASFVSFVRMLAFRCSFTLFALPRENCSPLPSCSRLFSSLSWPCSIFSSSRRSPRVRLFSVQLKCSSKSVWWSSTPVNWLARRLFSVLSLLLCSSCW